MKLWIKTLLFLTMLIVQSNDSLAEGVSTPTTNNEALSFKSLNFREATRIREYALTKYYRVYIRSARSERAQIYCAVPEYSAVQILDKQEKWYRVRYFDEGKQVEGWIPNSADIIFYVEEHDGEFDELIKHGTTELLKISIEREVKRRMQKIDALEIKNSEISELDYKGKSDIYYQLSIICDELSKIDFETKNNLHNLTAGFYRNKLDFYKNKLNEHALEQEHQAKLKSKKLANQLIGAKVYILNSCDLRTEPYGEGKHIFNANRGTVFKVISVEHGEDNDWYRVRAADGKEGYLSTVCVTNDRNIVEKKKDEETLQKKLKEKAKLERGVNIGMSMEQCKKAWGKPSSIHNTTTQYGTNSQWCYGDYCSSALYFENGILTAIQN